MEKIRRLNESLLAKIIGVVLLCALGAGIVYNPIFYSCESKKGRNIP